MLTSLSVSLFYAHEDAGIWSLMDLAANKGVIAPDDLSADSFFQAQGGLHLLHDRFHTFLRTAAAGDLASYVYFLLGTLAEISPNALPDDLAKLATTELQGEDLSKLVLKKKGGALSLAYLDPQGKAPSGRLSPYFDNVEIPTALWKKEAAVALDEYFAVAGLRAKGASDSRLGKLVVLWKAHRGKLTA